MVISMRQHATKEEIEHVCERIQEFGYKVHSIVGESRVVIGVVGVGDVTACLESLEATPGVETAVRISAPYKFVSREFRKERSAIKLNGIEIGGAELIVMAGPCSVESEKQIMQTAEGVAAAGAKVLRGGAFKPRTSPYDFQGMELEGLKLLRKAKEATGLATVTEVMSDRDIVAHGNPNVILCERGIRTFETATRNTCDITAVPVLNELTHLPVVLDPSHATGKRSLVPALARAGVAIGADGLIVEVHPYPEKAVSDGAQSLPLDGFAAMMRDLAPYIEMWRQARAAQAAALATSV